MPGKAKHSAKFDRCVKKVKRKGGAASPFAVCKTTVGNKGKKKTRKKKSLRSHSPAAKSRLRAAKSRADAMRRKKKARRNPQELAAEKFEQFHGHPPEQVVDVTTPVDVHSVLAGIGKLVQLDIKPAASRGVVHLSRFESHGKPAYLCESEGKRGPQLYIEGGDQSVDLAMFGLKSPHHEFEVLGECLAVYYKTNKTHLRDEDGGKAVYKHRFGFTRDRAGRHVRVKGSRPPVIVYDTRNRLLSFAGGSYTIPSEGIDG